MNRDFVERYAAGGSQLRGSFAGLSREQMNAVPVPGTWSIQQIVIHMMDSDLIGSDRMKRVAAEENPTLIGYNETAFAGNLFYDELDPQTACDIFEKNRSMTAEILRRLSDAHYDRVGQHNEHGQMTLKDLVTTYADHLDHHLKFIRQKRALVGG